MLGWIIEVFVVIVYVVLLVGVEMIRFVKIKVINNVYVMVMGMNF